jgi:hypothetical protein
MTFRAGARSLLRRGVSHENWPFSPRLYGGLRRAMCKRRRQYAPWWRSSTIGGNMERRESSRDNLRKHHLDFTSASLIWAGALFVGPTEIRPWARLLIGRQTHIGEPQAVASLPERAVRIYNSYILWPMSR